MLCQLFDFLADHGGIDDGDADLMFANHLVGLGQCVGVVHRVHAARRFLDRCQELLVLGQNQDVDRP